MKDDTVYEFSYLVVSHAIHLRATQLANSATVQVVDVLVVMKCNRCARLGRVLLMFEPCKLRKRRLKTASKCPDVLLSCLTGAAKLGLNRLSRPFD